jgi:hypothetical protein
VTQKIKNKIKKLSVDQANPVCNLEFGAWNFPRRGYRGLRRVWASKFFTVREVEIGTP